MWILVFGEIFGPEARIIEDDLKPEFSVWPDYGLEIYIRTQSNSKFWKSLSNELGSLDIEIKDYGHIFIKQITTQGFLVNENIHDGLIVPEDTQSFDR